MKKSMKKSLQIAIFAILALGISNCDIINPKKKSDDTGLLLLGAFLLNQQAPQYVVTMVGQLNIPSGTDNWRTNDSKFIQDITFGGNGTTDSNIISHTRVYKSARLMRLTGADGRVGSENIQQITTGADSRGRFALSFRVSSVSNNQITISSLALPNSTIQAVVTNTPLNSDRVAPADALDNPGKFDTSGSSGNLDKLENYTDTTGTITFTINGELDADREDEATKGNIPSVTIDSAGNDFTAQINQIRVANIGSYNLIQPTTGERVCDGANVSGIPPIVTGTISGNQTWSGARIIRGTVDVSPGVVITVQPGTVIFGERGSSIFFLRSGDSVAQLNAIGTKESPICWTSASNPGARFPGDWGGIVTIGNAGSTRTALTEGTTPRVYGGAPSANIVDNVKMEYNIVEFGGNEVAPGDELNNLSMYATRSILTHVQAHRGLDDQFEQWGGSAQWNKLLATGGLDDDFDIDEGITGTITNIIGHKYPVACGGSPSGDPHGFEMDGTHSGTANACGDNNLSRCSNTAISNFTLIGSNIALGEAMRLREGMAGTIENGVAYNFAGNGNQVLRDASSGTDFPATTTTLNNVLFESGKSAGNRNNGDAFSLTNSPFTLNEMPINSTGSTAQCGFGAEKPDYRLKAAYAARIGGASDAAGGEWYKDWTAYRGR